MALISRLAALIEDVRLEYAPDPRLAIYDVEVAESRGIVTLTGSTSEPRAAEALHRWIARLDGGIEVVDRVRRLPDAALRGSPHALVRAAMAPIMAAPLISEALISQTVLGHRLLVLRERGRWLQCRSVDGYIGWVHRGYVRRVDEGAASEWEMGANGAMCFSLGAEVSTEDGVLARLPWGAHVVRDDGDVVRLPDGSAGRVVGELVPAPEMARRFPRSGEALVETGMRWLGAPYLWGGITRAGVDCSGLAQVLHRTHGIELPRDSDQQATRGERVDPGPDFSRLLPGDLLYFAEEPGQISHVAISTGGSGILHSSLGNGGVRRNDLCGDLRYERVLRGLFVVARRMITPPAG